MFSLGSRFGGVVVRDENEIALANIEDFVTHQELQRFENERFDAELAAERAKRPVGRPSKITPLTADSEPSISTSSVKMNRLSSPKPRGRPRKVIVSNSATLTSIRPKGPRGRPKRVVAAPQVPTHSITVEIPSPMKAKIDTLRESLQDTQSLVSNTDFPAPEDHYRDELADSEEVSQSSENSISLKPIQLALSMAAKSSKQTAGLLQTASLRQTTLSSPQRTTESTQSVRQATAFPNAQPLLNSPRHHETFLPIRTTAYPTPHSAKQQATTPHIRQDNKILEPPHKNYQEIPSHIQDELLKSLFSEAATPPPPAKETSRSHDRSSHSRKPRSPHRDPNPELDDDADTDQDAICLLRQFQSPIPAPSHQTPHRRAPAPSPRKTPTMQDSPKSHDRVSMTPHYPSRRSIGEVLGKRMMNEGSGRVRERKRKRGREGKAVAKESERGREESIEL